METFPDRKKIAILGISAYYHDSAAALLVDGKIIAAAHEERFTRKKHDDRFPKSAIEYVLAEQGIGIEDLDAIAFYDKPFLKFERLLEIYHVFSPKGFKSFALSMPVWIKEKIFMRGNIWKELEDLHGGEIKKRPALLFPEHHLSHAASAFYPSPFGRAAILTVDGVGEWATTTIAHGDEKNISILEETHFPHSLGLLYSAFTYYCGFKVNSGEYKLMGLAPYGSARVNDFKKKILDTLVSLKEDGSLALNMEYFQFATGDRMCDSGKWEALFGIPPRPAESDITQEHSDMALAIQEITEEAMLRLARHAKKLTNAENLCLAGGVALNCVANEKIREAKIFKDVWIQPAAGDAGGALGAAFAGYHIWADKERVLPKGKSNSSDAMEGSYLGPEFSDIDTMRVVRKYGAVFKKYENFDELAHVTAAILADGQVVGWMQGRMEWGPRALGNRSILGDPRNPEMQKKLNLKIKQREGFRPFAPSVLVEDMAEYFETNTPSPYMLFTAPLKSSRRKPLAPADKPLFERLYTPRSDIPSVTHLDYSARIQTVSKETNEKYWKLIHAFKEKTGYGIIINTSFNVRNEPIICTPEDAYRCFMSTEMDYLVIGNILFSKKTQPTFISGTFNRTFNELD